MTQVEDEFEKNWLDLCRWFDWSKVHKAMIAIDWKCPDVDGELKIGDVIATAYMVCRKAWQKGYHKTGGFEARRVDDYGSDSPNVTRLSLEFTLESWSTSQ